MLNDETAQRFAEAIAKDLFTNGNGEHGSRLVMVSNIQDDSEIEINLGGWSESAVVGRIKKHLTGEIDNDNR